MYTRFSKVFYFLSIGLFLLVFLYVYAGSMEYVTYQVDERGMPARQLTRDAFFYITVVSFLVYNILMIIPGKLIELQYSLKIKRLFPKGDAFRDKMLAWIYSFTAILNLSSVIVIFYIYRISNQNEINISSFNFFFYLVPLFLLIWILGLFFILSKKMNQMKSRGI